MAWGKLDSADGTGATSFDTGTFTANTFLTFMSYIERSGDATNTEFRMGNDSIDTGSNYARRRSAEGGSDDTSVNQDGINLRTAGIPEFYIGYIVNIASEEKLAIINVVPQGSAGAGNTPFRAEIVAKWVNTSSQANILGFYSGGSNTLSSTSNLSVLGDGVTPASAIPAKIQDGLLFEETDTNKHYIYTASTDTWTEI